MVFKQKGKTQSVKSVNNLTVSRGDGSPTSKKRAGDKFITMRGSKRVSIQGLDIKSSPDREIINAIRKSV